MNRTVIRRIVVGVVLLASAVAAFLLASARGEDMSTSEKPLRQAYAVWPDGSRSYGAYCNKNGTKLEGGGICYIDEFSRPYTHDEIVRESIGHGLLWMVVFGASGSFLAFVLIPTPEDRKSRATATV